MVLFHPNPTQPTSHGFRAQPITRWQSFVQLTPPDGISFSHLGKRGLSMFLDWIFVVDEEECKRKLRVDGRNGLVTDGT
jgi:hypothetical protein